MRKRRERENCQDLIYCYCKVQFGAQYGKLQLLKNPSDWLNRSRPDADLSSLWRSGDQQAK